MFYLLKELNGANNVGSTMKIPVSAGTAARTVKLCSVLKKDGTVASGATATPAYLVMEGGKDGKTIAANETDNILVTPINGDMIFEAEIANDISGDVNVGTELKIDSNGLKVDALGTGETSGTVIVVETPESKKAKAKIRVKFKV